MGANKRFWFSSFFSTPGMALEAMFHAASENLSTNADAGNLECLAKVLTKPIPLSTDDTPEVRAVLAPANEPQDPQGGWLDRVVAGVEEVTSASTSWFSRGDDDEETSASTSANASGQRYARFKFFARIELEGEKQFTEHSLLTDICDLDATADKYSTACLIGNSIMCYSQQDYNGMRPKVGDIVKIKLRPGDVHRDIQHADFVGLDTTAEVGHSAAGTESCQANLSQNIAAIFDGLLGNAAGSGETEPTPNFDPIIPEGTPSQFPTRGSITSGFTYYRCGVLAECAPHPGQDIGAANGTEIYPALNNGVVIGFNPEYTNGALCQEGDRNCGHGSGNYIRIRHNIGGRTIHTSYNHLSAINVTLNQPVDMTTKIGEVGHTGQSTGAHLHWEVYDGAITRRHRMPDGQHGDPNRMSHVDPIQGLRLEQQMNSRVVDSRGRVRVIPGGAAPTTA